jgi:hypothetical protein
LGLHCEAAASGPDSENGHMKELIDVDNIAYLYDGVNPKLIQRSVKPLIEHEAHQKLPQTARTFMNQSYLPLCLMSTLDA